jgi:hypothetical protein
MAVIRMFLFSPRLQSGYELWAITWALITCAYTTLLGITIFVVCLTRRVDAQGIPSLAVALSCVFWFTYRKHYDVLVSGFIGFGALLVYHAVMMGLYQVDPSQWAPFLLMGLCFVIRFYSVGPTKV